MATSLAKPLPDSSDIDNAIVAVLGSDLQLLALMPDGVYIDHAPPGAQRFVILSIVQATDEPVFGGRAFEDILYMIEPRALSTTGGNVKDAAARIQALLEDVPLTVAGFVWMTTHRDGRQPERVEQDEVDPAIRWLRRGAYYRVQMAIA